MAQEIQMIPLHIAPQSTHHRRASNVSSNDPFSRAMQPPLNETSIQRQTRLRDEAVARKRSDQIDKLIKDEMTQLKKQRANERTILLLGQAGAGKTTILKQMRLIYAAEKQASMRQAWVDVIYLNVIMALKLLLEAMESIELLEMKSSQAVLEQTSLSPASLKRFNSSGCFTTSSEVSGTSTLKAIREPSKVLLARLRLAPFLSIESELRKKLGAFERDGSMSTSKSMSTIATEPGGGMSSTNDSILRSGFGSANLRRHQYAVDLLLRAGWQDELIRSSSSLSSDIDSRSMADSTTSGVSARRRMAFGAKLTRRATSTADDRGIAQQKTSRYIAPQKEDDPSRLLSACVHEVWELWEGVSSERIKRRLYGADSASYFLSNIARIASANYCPIDDDILHARVRTMGATEEHFTVDRSLAYRIIDVGGSRSQRNVWAQFFDDATAIIFLAPISAFDEVLEEDLSVNRIVDSLDIWRQIIANPLLYNVSLILFLNKMDILRYKLESGVQIKDFFPEYEKDNTYEEAWRFFRSLFHKSVSDNRSKAPTRNLYVHKTTATSTKEIKIILISTKDAILRHHLKESGFTL